MSPLYEPARAELGTGGAFVVVFLDEVEDALERGLVDDVVVVIFAAGGNALFPLRHLVEFLFEGVEVVFCGDSGGRSGDFDRPLGGRGRRRSLLRFWLGFRRRFDFHDVGLD